MKCWYSVFWQTLDMFRFVHFIRIISRSCCIFGPCWWRQVGQNMTFFFFLNPNLVSTWLKISNVIVNKHKGATYRNIYSADVVLIQLSLCICGRQQMNKLIIWGSRISSCPKHHFPSIVSIKKKYWWQNDGGGKTSVLFVYVNMRSVYLSDCTEMER